MPRRRHSRPYDESTGREGASYDDLAGWIASYLSREGVDASDGRGRTARRHVRWSDLFEDGHGRPAWPDELHEHLAALREQIHGISERQYGRGRGGRRRRRHAGREEYRGGDPAPDSGRGSQARSVAWAVFIRLAVLVVTVVAARGRARRRSRPRRGFSV